MEQGRRVSAIPVTWFMLIVFCSEIENSLPSMSVPNKAQSISTCSLSCIILNLPLAFPFLCNSAFWLSLVSLVRKWGQYSMSCCLQLLLPQKKVMLFSHIMHPNSSDLCNVFYLRGVTGICRPISVLFFSVYSLIVTQCSHRALCFSWLV